MHPAAPAGVELGHNKRMTVSNARRVCRPIIFIAPLISRFCVSRNQQYYGGFTDHWPVRSLMLHS